MNGVTRLKIKRRSVHIENVKKTFLNIFVWIMLLMLAIGSISLIALGSMGVDSFMNDGDFWVTTEGIAIFLSTGMPLCFISLILMGIWNKVTKRSHQWESLIG